jgi:hypothetical protein
MSSVVIPCPGCQSPLAITAEMVGQTIACPACRQTIQLAGTPAPAGQGPSAPAAPAFIAPQPAAKPAAAGAKRHAPLLAIGGAVLLTWGVVLTLLVVSGVLIYGLRLRAIAEEEAAIVAEAPPQAVPQAKPLPRPAPVPNAPTPTTPVAPQFRPQQPAVIPTTPTPSPITPQQPRVQPQPVQPNPIQPTTAPPPQPASPAPPPPAADPLAGLADVWRLPALISTQPEKAATLAREPSEPLSMSIRGLAADVPASAAIFTEATSPGSAWDILFVSDLASGTGRVKLAELRRDQLDFSFVWAEPLADAALRRQMSNCVLEVRHGNTAKAVQLREPLKPGPWTISMSDGVQTAEFTVPDPPKSDALRLEIRELVSFPRDVALREEHKSIAAGQKALIQFTEMPGAELGVQLIRLASGTLVVRVQSEFKENAATKFEMSLSRLADLEEGMSKSLDRAKRELPVARDTADDLKSALSSAQAKRATTLLEQTARDQAIASLAGKLKRAVNKVGSLQKQIAESEARLSAVPKIRRFLESLDQKAQIRFAVCAECGDRDLVLIDGTQPAGAE